MFLRRFVPRLIVLLGLLISLFHAGTPSQSQGLCVTCLHPDPGSGICVACGDWNDWGGKPYDDCYPIQEVCACALGDRCEIASG